MTIPGSATNYETTHSCRHCHSDIRREGRRWVLAWWTPGEAWQVPDPYACPGQAGHEPEEEG